MLLNSMCDKVPIKVGDGNYGLRDNNAVWLTVNRHRTKQGVIRHLPLAMGLLLTLLLLLLVAERNLR